MQKDRFRNLDAANDKVLLGEESPNAAHVGPDRGVRRDISAADVLGQKFADGRKHFTVVEPVHKIAE
jgi:hypothetical protein